jgi:sensor c-di-GMP phosphodiesterase-like protein
MASQERGFIALIILVLTLPIILALMLKHSSKEDVETKQAKSYASSVLRENKEVFDKLAEM